MTRAHPHAQVGTITDANERESLPDGWCFTTVHEVTERVSNIRPDSSPARFFDYADISSIDSKNQTITSLKHFAGKDAPSRARRPVRPGDVLFSNVRTYLRNIALVKGALVPDVCSTGFTVLRPNSAILPEYLLRYVLTSEFIDRISETQTGTHYPATSDRAVFSQMLPLAPLAEQRRIVEMLETLLGKLSSCRDRIERVPAILSRFRQAVLAAACSGRLTEEWREEHPNIASLANVVRLTGKGEHRVRRGVPADVEIPDELAAFPLPPKWELVSCAELLYSGALIDVKDGNHGANHPKANEFSETGVPFITAAQVTDAGIDYEGAPKVSGAVLGQLKVGFAEINDVILTHKGSVGRVAVSTRQCVLTPQTTYYRCRPDSLDPGYLAQFLRSLHFYRQLAPVMSQTTRDFVPISEQYKLFVFVPPLEEQREIRRRVDAILALSDQTTERLRHFSARTETIRQSVFAKAFRGELVPTEAELAAIEGREYETAEELVARVRREIGEKPGTRVTPRKRRGRGKQVA